MLVVLQFLSFKLLQFDPSIYEKLQDLQHMGNVIRFIMDNTFIIHNFLKFNMLHFLKIVSNCHIGDHVAVLSISESEGVPHCPQHIEYLLWKVLFAPSNAERHVIALFLSFLSFFHCHVN